MEATKSTYATVGLEFFQELGRMMKEHGVTVPRAKNYKEPTDAELKIAEEILSGTTDKVSVSGAVESGYAIKAPRRREVTSTDALKRYLVKPSPKNLLYSETGVSIPTGFRVRIKGQEEESVYFASTQKPLVAFNVGAYLDRGCRGTTKRVPSISFEANSLILLRVTSLGEAHLESTPPEKSKAVLSLLERWKIEGDPYCPPSEIRLHPALIGGRAKESGDIEEALEINSLNKILRVYGVPKGLAADYIAQSARSVSIKLRGKEYFLRYPKVASKSLLRMLDGKSRAGDELRLEFLRAFCEGLLSHNVIYLREQKEIVSRNEFQSRFPGVRISDRHLRMTIKKRKVERERLDAIATRREERKEELEAKRAKREARKADLKNIIDKVGACIYRAFNNGILIENVAAHLTDQGFQTLKGDNYWTVMNVRIVYHLWLEQNGIKIEAKQTSANNGYNTMSRGSAKRAPKPESPEIEIKKSAQRVFTELVLNHFCPEVPRETIKFQGIVEIKEPETRKTSRVGVYRFQSAVKFTLEPDSDGRAGIEARIQEGAVAITKKVAGRVVFSMVPPETGDAFLKRVAERSVKGREPSSRT